jgi:hypothetical protein
MAQLTEDSTKEATASNGPSMPESENGSSDYYIDPVKEKRMMRKFDVSHKSFCLDNDMQD